MRGRSILAILIGCALLSAAVVFLYFYDTDPNYNGHTLQEWIKASSQPYKEREAREAIIRITTNSTPVLLRWVFADTSPRFSLIHRLPLSVIAVSSNPLLRRLFYRDKELFRAACAMRAFEIAGTNAACAVPALSGLITDRNSQSALEILHVCSLIGPPALPAIRQAMTSPYPHIRTAAIGCLKPLGLNATEAIPDVVKALSDYDINVRQNATNVLESLYPAAPTNAPAQ